MISNSDLQKCQKSIQGITAAQNELSPEELSSISALVTLLNSSNFGANESSTYVRVIKNALPQHTNNRLLQVHLKNFVALCEQYFKIGAQPATTQNANTDKQGSNKNMILIVAALIIGYLVYDNWDSVSKILGKKSTDTETIRFDNITDGNINIIEDSIVEEVLPESVTVEIERKQTSISSVLSTRLLTEDDLRGMSKHELMLLRNEIFARHGRKFKTREIREYFLTKDWYNPQYEEVTHLLNRIELKNVEFIKKHE